MSILKSQRDRFILDEKITYLNCSYMALKLKEVHKAGQESLEQFSKPWLYTPEHFFETVEKCRTLYASIIGACADQIAVIPSVSYGMALAAQNVSIQFGKEILVLKDQFPSNIYAWRRLAKHRSLRIVTIDHEPGKSLTEVLLDNIHENTSLVCVPQVRWSDGALLDLEAISKKAQSFGASLVVDGIQSVGAYPFDVKKIKPAFMAVSSYKWLLGPYNLGFLYVDEDYLESEPIEFNWMNRRGSENFKNLTEYQEQYQAGARRFDMGEKTQFLQMPMAEAAMRQILKWGVENIQESIGRLSSPLRKELQEMGFTILDARESVAHIIGIREGERKFGKNLEQSFKKAGIYISFRGDVIRVSPHIYNTSEELGRFLEILKGN